MRALPHRVILVIPYGLTIMNTAWSEASLSRWASAIEDLQVSSGTKWKRQLPL